MAVLQLTKDTPERRSNNRKGAYDAHQVVAIYEDHEITEPASEGSSLYFLKVQGVKQDYVELLEDLTGGKEEESNEEYQEGEKRKAHTLDFNKLSKKEKDDKEIKSNKSQVMSKFTKKTKGAK